MYRHASGFHAGPTFDLVGARYADFDNGYRIGAYQLLGLRAGIERERWSVFAELRNALDKAHVGQLAVRDRAGVDDALLQAGAPRRLPAAWPPRCTLPRAAARRGRRGCRRGGGGCRPTAPRRLAGRPPAGALTPRASRRVAGSGLPRARLATRGGRIRHGRGR